MHLLYASSSSVYGGNKATPFSTNHQVDHPVSLYATTKNKMNKWHIHIAIYMVYQLQDLDSLLVMAHGEDQIWHNSH